MKPYQRVVQLKLRGSLHGGGGLQALNLIHGVESIGLCLPRHILMLHRSVLSIE